jgi:hypothetical protein
MTRPIGMTALSMFFAGGAGLAAISAVSLAWPGSVLEPMWQLTSPLSRHFWYT